MFYFPYLVTSGFGFSPGSGYWNSSRVPRTNVAVETTTTNREKKAEIWASRPDSGYSVRFHSLERSFPKKVSPKSSSCGILKNAFYNSDMWGSRS